MSWIEFWDSDTSIYVNDVHRRVHYRLIADQLAESVAFDGARLLDVGCGEALSAARLADRCAQLVLCEAAPRLRRRLEERFAEHARISVASPAHVGLMPEASFDVIIANSVVQYFTTEELATHIQIWRRLLVPNGKLLLGDLLPRELGMVTDALALLQFARGQGFLLAASVGLVRTLISDYRRKRAELGLLRFDEAEIIQLLHASGFAAQRLPKNLGHNNARMTVLASAVDPCLAQLVKPELSPGAMLINRGAREQLQSEPIG